MVRECDAFALLVFAHLHFPCVSHHDLLCFGFLVKPRIMSRCAYMNKETSGLSCLEGKI